MGVKFPGKIITKVYGLTLLARYYRYEGLGGCQISRKNHYKSVRFNVIGTLLSLRGVGWVSYFQEKSLQKRTTLLLL